MSSCVPLGSGAFWPVLAGHDVIDLHRVVVVRDAASQLPVAGGVWLVQPWLTAILLSAAWSIGGVGALSWTCMAVSAVLGMQMFRIASSWSSYGRSFCVAAGALVVLMPLMLRAELFAALLCATLIVEMQQQRRWVWTGPLVLVAWANVHGSFPIGLAICLAMVAGMMAPSRVARARVRVKIMWIAACVGATFISPLTWRTWSYVQRVMGSDEIDQLTPLWQPMELASIDGVMVIAMLGIMTWSIVRRSGGWMRLAPMLPIIVLACACLESHRYVTWFVLVAVSELARSINDVTLPPWLTLQPGLIRALLHVFGAGLLVAFIVMLPLWPWQRSIAMRGLPADVLLDHITPSDTVFASAEWADYIRLRRQARVVVDARLERYRSSDLHRYDQAIGTGRCRKLCDAPATRAVLRSESAHTLMRRLEDGGCMVDEQGHGGARGAVYKLPCRS